MSTSKNQSAERVFVVAEISANHHGRIETARETIQAIAAAGADAVKLQTYTADTLTIQSERPEFLEATSGTIWEGRTLYDLYQEAFTPWEWHRELKDYAESLGLTFFSSPFDPTAVDFLDALGVPMYKIASFEITDIPLIRYAASRGKPMILSTGIADAGDILAAVEACRQEGNEDITLLQCTSSYPAPVDLANLRMIPSLAETFGVKAGLSDHTPGATVAIAATALGARMIEKHFILDRTMGGPDAPFSMEPEEFRDMIGAVRDAESALGRVDYGLTERKQASRRLARSLFVVKEVPAGSRLSPESVRSIRPGHGLPPRHLPEVIGRFARRDLHRGEPLSWDMLS